VKVLNFETAAEILERRAARKFETACSAVCGQSVCERKTGHFGKHFDGAGTTWSSAGAARVQKEKAEAERLRDEHLLKVAAEEDINVLYFE
jgi:hypothetical protein